MTKSNLRFAIIALTVATALIHLSLGLSFGGTLFILNGLGYLGLLWLFFWPPKAIKISKALVFNGFLLYIVVTIVLYFVFNLRSGYDAFGVGTKVIEGLLLAALWKHK